MSVRYRNRTTEQVITKPERSPRLESLSSNWERLDDATEAPPSNPAAGQAAQAAAAAAEAAERAAEAAETASQSEPAAGSATESRDDVQAAAGDNGASTEHGEKPDRPSKSAARKTWADYALALGHTEDEIAELTKAQIVELVDRRPEGAGS